MTIQWLMVARGAEAGLAALQVCEKSKRIVVRKFGGKGRLFHRLCQRNFEKFLKNVCLCFYNAVIL